VAAVVDCVIAAGGRPTQFSGTMFERSTVVLAGD
jgi:hypothetical protein